MPGLVQFTFPAFAPPDRVNWVDYRARIDATNTDAFAHQVLARAAGHTIWYVSAGGYNHLFGKCEAVGSALARARPNQTTPVVADQNIFEYMGLTVFHA